MVLTPVLVSIFSSEQQPYVEVKASDMAERNKLDGISAAEVARIANEDGQLGAALELGVSQSAVSRFLRKHGYQSVTVYIGDGENVTITESGASVSFAVVDANPEMTDEQS